MTRSSIALVDVLYWPIVQVSISAILVRVPARVFAQDNWITRSRNVERSLRMYRALGIRTWKKRLPDAAALVGGTRKHVNPYSPSDAARFVTELRRAEVAHWVQLACAIPCWFWNPVWASVVMTAYAVAVNAPCIATQRNNRNLIQRRATMRSNRPLTSNSK